MSAEKMECGHSVYASNGRGCFECEEAKDAEIAALRERLAAEEGMVSILRTTCEAHIAEIETAEATVAALAAVVRAAEHLQMNVRFVECRPNCDECEMATNRLKDSFASLTPAQRRAAGIE